MSSKYENYSFDAFLKKRNSFDYYRDSPFLQGVLKKYTNENWEELNEKLLSFSQKASSKWRELADQSAREEVHPYLQQYDAHNHRCDRIIRPYETLTLEKEVFSEGFFSENTTVWEQIAKRFLLHQNGEAGVMCPIACTDGLIDLLENYLTEDDPNYDVLHEILLHVKEGINGDFGIGAQFVSEIQGGSNIPVNILQAVQDGDVYRLYGNKFFCSAAHADYAVVTARVKDTDEIGLFVVPSWGEGGKIGERRNGYEINRLKFKLGTSELPTAEIDYKGAIAYPIGPINKGVALVVGVVLTKSRLDIGQASSAFMTRAAREALLYAQFREVFGKQINEYPIAIGQLKQIERTAKRTTAGNFKLYDMYLKLNNQDQAKLNDLELKKRNFELRELIMMQKIVSARDAVSVIRDAISIFGGHGVIEDFSALPRIYRDAMVNELWEGPRNVLLSQIYRDILKASKWYDLEELMANFLKGAPEEIVKGYAKLLKEYMAKPTVLIEATPENIEESLEWGEFCESIFRTYQEVAFKEVEDSPFISPNVL